MEKMAEEYGKTSVQKKYLEKKYNKIKLPVEYESYSSWDTMIMYVETYSIILAIIVGFICACLLYTSSDRTSRPFSKKQFYRRYLVR